jgi:hypothetical protein
VVQGSHIRFSVNLKNCSRVYDNFYIKNRFVNRISPGAASIEPGLFYRFRFGSNIEFVCIDTSKQTWLCAERYFKGAEISS